MPQPSQTRSNHTRYDPAFHFFLIPIGLILFIWTIVHVIRHPGTDAAILAVAAFLIVLTAFKARLYALRVQDRVIRLEERLRLSMCLPEKLRPRISELTEPQLIGLRFASDPELPSLAERALNEKLTGKQIKEAVANWRADYLRV
jgi:Family of unknown function (DUF6526)